AAVVGLCAVFAGDGLLGRSIDARHHFPTVFGLGIEVHAAALGVDRAVLAVTDVFAAADGGVGVQHAHRHLRRFGAHPAGFHQLLDELAVADFLLGGIDDRAPLVVHGDAGVAIDHLCDGLGVLRREGFHVSLQRRRHFGFDLGHVGAGHFFLG